MELEKKMKKVPKGTSEYQAAWIADEEDEDGESEYEDEESDEDEEFAMMQQSDDEEAQVRFSSQILYCTRFSKYLININWKHLFLFQNADEKEEFDTVFLYPFSIFHSLFYFCIFEK